MTLRTTRPGSGNPAVFDRARLATDAVTAARALLGALLVRDDDTGRRVGRIVEVEAYAGPEDRASHARFGPNGRSAVMFGRAGVAYVYLVYGMHHCFNVVAGPDGAPSAVLIRAVEPLEGVDVMRASRARVQVSTRKAPPADALTVAADRIARIPTSRVASGPALVCAAFGVDRSWTGTDLCDPASPLRLETDGAAASGSAAVDDRIVASRRIGIEYAGERWVGVEWRFHLASSGAVSGRQRAG